jgi:hypothetical protein
MMEKYPNLEPSFVNKISYFVKTIQFLQNIYQIW